MAATDFEKTVKEGREVLVVFFCFLNKEQTKVGIFIFSENYFFSHGSLQTLPGSVPSIPNTQIHTT